MPYDPVGTVRNRTLPGYGNTAFSPPHIASGKLWRGLRIGLLGGSFNPAHDGHRHISLMALRHLGLDQVWWLVSPQNPLKPSHGMASMESRIEQAKRIARHPRIMVTDLEQQLGTQYTSDTLPALKSAFHGTDFVWLMGADNLSQIRYWDRWQSIFTTMPVAVFARSPYSLRACSSLAAARYQRHRLTGRQSRRLSKVGPPAWTFLAIPLHGASASAIRAAA